MVMTNHPKIVFLKRRLTKVVFITTANFTDPANASKVWGSPARPVVTKKLIKFKFIVDFLKWMLIPPITFE
ncbi:hypothetical protein ATANTOWER_005025 [Ataeniobius toweri]|uniref:Uncharacterized protein n=1 Tax=Ataeniobius toweri TaxID=208326 RepID=A0ABU7BND9_9TELE|nr:hypothetical protein [Ataeniobius toweri]